MEEKKEDSFPFVGYVILEPLCLFIQLDWIQQQKNSFRKIPVVLYVDQTRIPQGLERVNSPGRLGIQRVVLENRDVAVEN